jgi:bifunctional non-homologous end joining protein LigD
VRLPADDDAWGYEMAWGGHRTVAYVSGGRLRLVALPYRGTAAEPPEPGVRRSHLSPASPGGEVTAAFP